MTAVVQSQIIDPVSEAASPPSSPRRLPSMTIPMRTRMPPRRQRPAKKETFAERRARLAAEKAASEAAAEGEGAAEESEAEGAQPAAAAEPVVEPEPAAEPESEPEPAEPTAADLYARRPRKRKAVVDQLARELEAEDEAVAEAATADAPKGGDE